MKRHIVLALVCAAALCAGCSSDNPSDVDSPADDPITTASIGPEGGSLATEDFILDVPPGLVDSLTLTKVYELFP